ncbi:MAG: hypothetical protein MRZ48_04760 [Anaerostipes hadrus]|nr:hypothetical protein [Anaerostipes hadrus]
MTEEKYKEFQKKIVKAVENGSPTGMTKNIQEIAFDYAEMINEVVSPLNPLSAPIVAAALGYIRGTVLEALDSEQREAAQTIEMLLKSTIRAEKVDIK